MQFAVWGGVAIVLGVPFAFFTSFILQAIYGYFSPLPAFVILSLFASLTLFVFAQFFRRIRGFSTPLIFLSLVAAVIFAFRLGSRSDPFGGDAMWEFIGFALYVIIPAVSFILPFAAVATIRHFRESRIMRQWFSLGRGGKAIWGGISSVQNLNPDNAEMPAKGSIFLGATLFQDTLIKSDVYLSYADDSHHITIAQTGSGKSVTSIWPTLDNYDAPCVVLDPKGEHADYAATSRQPSWVLDPYGKTKAASRFRVGCNPLDEINIHADNARAYLTAISAACVFGEKGDNAHFSESAKTILEGVITHVLSRYPKKDHTLLKVVDLFRGYDSELGVSDPHAFDDVIADMSTNNAAGGVAMDAAGLLLNAGDRERGSMLTTCFRSLKWVNDPPMRRHLESSSSSLLKNLVQADGKETLFVVLPFEYMEEDSQIRWMRMIINLLNIHLFQNARDRQGQKKLLFILDEFFKLGYMPSIEEGIVTARGAGAKYWLLGVSCG